MAQSDRVIHGGTPCNDRHLLSPTGARRHIAGIRTNGVAPSLEAATTVGGRSSDKGLIAHFAKFIPHRSLHLSP